MPAARFRSFPSAPFRRVLLGAAACAGLSVLAAAPAGAVVYCTSAGYPAGCVVRVAPAPRAAIYCTRPGYPVGCVGRPGAAAVATPGLGAPGVGVQPYNRGGPVNRPGLR